MIYESTIPFKKCLGNFFCEAIRTLYCVLTLPKPVLYSTWPLNLIRRHAMPNEKKITLSVIKADVGGFVGHSSFHPALFDTAKEKLSIAKSKGALIDFHVIRCGDDLELIMTHAKGCDNKTIHELAWNTFTACTEVAKELKLYGAGQDLLKDAFTGTVKGMGPGVAEMDFVERKSEPVIIFMADKTSAGAWNLPLYKIFGDPFNTAGLVIDPSMVEGFCFNILDVREGKSVTLSCPEDTYYLLSYRKSTRL